MVKNYPGLGQKPYYTELKEYIEASVGKSAYEVAVADGFVGTEAEWLASLKGTKGDKGDTGDTGPMGASGVNPGDIPVTQGDLLVGGATSALEPLPLPSYGQELRRKGVQLAWGRAKEAYLNDRNDIDATGVVSMGAIITTYLAEYQAAGFSAIYLDAGSRYKVMAAAPVDVPKGITLFAGEATNYFTDAAQRAQFIAGESGATILRLLGQKASLNGVSINLGRSSGYTGVVGVRPNDGWNRITNSYFANCDVTSTGVKGGGLLYFEFDHNMFSGGWNGMALDILDVYADNPAAVYYGANVAWYHHNTFAQSIRVEGNSQISDNDFEGGAGSQWPAITFQTDAYQTVCNITGNYFEMSGNNQGILFGNGARGEITGNVIEGSAASVVGSYGISTGYLHGTDISGNHFGDLETGIIIGSTTEGAWSSQTMMANTFSGVTTPVSGGRRGIQDLSSNTTGSRHANLSMRGDGRVTYTGALTGGTVYMGNNQANVVDLRQGNLFIIDKTSANTLTVANDLPSGQVFHLAFRKGGQTLQNSVWRLLSGVDEAPAAGTVKTFITTDAWNWGVREVGAPARPSTAVTANATATLANRMYLVDATAGAVTITLPNGRNSVTTPGTDFIIRKTDASANVVNIQSPVSTQMVGGVRPYTLTRQGDWVWVMTNNTGTDANVRYEIIAGNQFAAATVTGELRHSGTTAGFFGATPVTKPAALTAADATAIDATWDAAEQGVVENLRTRVNELESRLKSLGLLS